MGFDASATPGLRVIATARRPETMSGLEAIGVETLKLDVTDSASIKSVREQVSNLLGGKLDILVNNAGQGVAPQLSRPQQQC
jgi:1-acylglycerone phosphate reductase